MTCKCDDCNTSTPQPNEWDEMVDYVENYSDGDRSEIYDILTKWTERERELLVKAIKYVANPLEFMSGFAPW